MESSPAPWQPALKAGMRVKARGMDTSTLRHRNNWGRSSSGPGLVFFRHRTRVRFPHALLMPLSTSGKSPVSQAGNPGSVPGSGANGMSPNGMAPGLGPGITRVRFPPSRPFRCSSMAELPAVNRLMGVRISLSERNDPVAKTATAAVCKTAHRSSNLRWVSTR
jgi:hypothetical protein